MLLKNTTDRYGGIIVYLHWIMAIIVIGLLTLGLYMVGLPVSLRKLQLFGLHKEFGITILILVLFRFIWRFFNITPLLPLHMPDWQKAIAHLTHFSLYGFMIAMPLTGWAMSSAAGVPVSFFGLFLLPDFVSPSEHLRMILLQVHKYLGFALIAVICAHIGAAFYHYLFLKDNIFRRMAPW